MNSRIFISSAALVLSGCAHLEQAPLVYTSKTSFGLEVSTTSTESPGISMIVGYKQIDAAYVPVAVARKCGSDEREISELEADLCEEKSFHEIKMVSGSSNEGGLSSIEQDSVSKTLMNELNQRMSYQDSAMKDVESLRRVLKTADDALAELKKRKREYEATLIAIPKSEKEIAVANVTDIKKVERTIKPETETNNSIEILFASPDNYSAEILSRENKIDELRESLKIAETKYKDAQAEVESVVKKMRMARMDAYSVFGSFNSKGKAASDSASFQLGKIFATGVASQSISSGLSKMYEHQDDSKRECFKAISVALKGAGQPSTQKMHEDLKQMLEICRSL